MATESERYNKALAKWDDHLANDRVSVHHEDGVLAVILPRFEASSTESRHIEPYKRFEREAMAVADDAHRRGKKVALAVDATRDDFRAILQDPNVSDITLIANGCLSAIQVSGNARPLDWFNISRMGNHLKTGLFTQRICGLQSRKLNVPLGLFAVTQPEHVIAPVGRFIRPNSLRHRHNQHLVSVSHKHRLSVEDIKTDFPQQTVGIAQKLMIYLDIGAEIVRGSAGYSDQPHDIPKYGSALGTVTSN